MRKYREQYHIEDFDKLTYDQRRYEVGRLRMKEILRLQSGGSAIRKHLKQTKKNYRNTEAYIHLTHNERVDFIKEVSTCVSNFGFARLFAECIDKVHFDPARTTQAVDEQAFEQVISRFEHYLSLINSHSEVKYYGLVIHDNNPTVEKKLTELMKLFHIKGTLFTEINNIIETPLFVDSELTSMVQIADLCSYALRRYLENGEEELFDLIFTRADRKDGVVVGIRHFSDSCCQCKICSAHTK